MLIKGVINLKRLKRIIVIVAVLLSVTVATPSYFMGSVLTVQAHSGRTDSRGGHKDNKNKSGLGSYHYHCGGHPAHLHTNGVCPYDNSSSEATSSVVTNTTIANSDSSVTSNYCYTYTAKYKSASDDFANRVANNQFSKEILDKIPDYSNIATSLLSQDESEDYLYLKNSQDVDDMSKLMFIKLYDYILSQQTASTLNYDNAIFSAQYYIAKYPELVATIGNDNQALYNHFYNCGMLEGRQGCETFNVYTYIANNPDLQQIFGDNLVAYYQHYLDYGQYEGRIAY